MIELRFKFQGLCSWSLYRVLFSLSLETEISYYKELFFVFLNNVTSLLRRTISFLYLAA